MSRFMIPASPLCSVLLVMVSLAASPETALSQESSIRLGVRLAEKQLGFAQGYKYISGFDPHYSNHTSTLRHKDVILGFILNVSVPRR